MVPLKLEHDIMFIMILDTSGTEAAAQERAQHFLTTIINTSNMFALSAQLGSEQGSHRYARG